MKKIILVFLMLLVVLILIISTSIMGNVRSLSEIKKQNEEYEMYLDKQVFGTQVLTVINKATNENMKNKILKDEKGFFIPNDTNSIGVEIQMLSEGKKSTYLMETIQKVGTQGFIKNFNLINFKCSKIEYHEQTKRVSKIIFEQIEE